jgi:cation:H+ antiporter
VGFVVLTWSADRFVSGAASIARDLGISTLVIGITIVGFGTSAPELLVSFMASLKGSSFIGIGNAIGSNITNTTLILGLTALVAPFVVNPRVVRREVPKLLGFTLFAAAMMWDGSLDRIDGAVLFTIFLFTLVVPFFGKASREEAVLDELGEEIPEPLPLKSAVFWSVTGLAALLASSWVLVWGATTGARALGVSEMVIGLTVVAVGTSLPELAASVAAVRKGEHDIAVGNVFGSNIFNILAVLAMPGLVAPGQTPEAMMERDIAVLVGVTLLFVVLAVAKGKPFRIGRGRALVLIATYVTYVAYLFMDR